MCVYDGGGVWESEDRATAALSMIEGPNRVQFVEKPRITTMKLTVSTPSWLTVVLRTSIEIVGSRHSYGQNRIIFTTTDCHRL